MVFPTIVPVHNDIDTSNYHIDSYNENCPIREIDEEVQSSYGFLDDEVLDEDVGYEACVIKSQDDTEHGP